MEKLERFLRPPVVFDLVGFQDTTIRELIEAGQFPKPVLIGTGKVKRRVWPESQIRAWIEARIRERDEKQADPLAA